MINKFLNFILISFSGLLALGKIDPFFPPTSFVSSIDIIFFVFCLTFILFKFKFFISSVLNIEFICLISIFTFFIFAQTIYGYETLEKPLLNFKFLLCILFFLILSKYLINNYKLIHTLLFVFSISCFFYTILVLFINPNFYSIIKGQLVVLDENPNSTSSRLAIAFIYFIYFILHNPLKWSKLRYLIFVTYPSLFLMVTMSGSRGSLLALLMGSYLIILFSNIKKIYKILLILLSSILSIFLFKYLFSSDDLSERWENALEGDTAGRADIWQAVFSIISNNPLGVGESGYVRSITSEYGYYIDTHNIFLYILVCGGFLSLLSFLIFLSFIFLKCFRSYRYRGEVLPLVLFLILLFIASKTGGVITFLLFWFILAIINSYREKING